MTKASDLEVNIDVLDDDGLAVRAQCEMLIY
jgi:hypothetical protein